MKKVFLLLAIASSSFFVSCSDDDDTTPPAPVATSIVLTSNATAIEVGESVTLVVTNNLGTVVTASSSFFSNDVAISGATFTPTAAGTYTLHATNGTLISNDVVVTVNAVAAMNSIFVNNTNNTVNNSATVFWGGWAADPNATAPTHGLFSMVALKGTGDILPFLMDPTTASDYIDVEFVVLLNADGSVQLPTMTNITYLDIYEAHVNNTEVTFTTQQSGTLVFATNLPAAIDSPFAFTATASYNNGSSLEVNYNGNWAGIFDATGGKVSVSTKAKLANNKAKFYTSLKK